MIASLFLVAGVGIGYGVHAKSLPILAIGVWVFLMACALAFMAGVARFNKAFDAAVSAERAQKEAKRPAHEVARKNVDDGVLLAWPSGQGDRRYPQEEDVEGDS